MIMRSSICSARQSGAALLAAMLTVTLVATFAAAALWQQFRSIEVEGAERVRVQSGWILTGALDWGRLILREDARSGGADHLAEPWAVPLNEARLSSFLSVDKTTTDNELEAFLSGQIIDLQSRLNVANLIEGRELYEPALLSFGRLFAMLGLKPQELDSFTGQLLQAALAAQGPAAVAGESGNVKTVKAPPPQSSIPTLMPQRVDQLVWLGLSPETLAALKPYITLLPVKTRLNLNTASAEVIYASTPGLELADAQRLVAARERSHFRSLADAAQILGGKTVRFDESDSGHGVASRYFEVRGQLRLDKVTVQEQSVVQRDGLIVRTLWRDRGVQPDLPAGRPARP
jgi:general secretion pathway protein K